jgi:hypothetical protein
MWDDALEYCKANGFVTMATVHSASEGKQVRELCAARKGDAANPASPCTCEGDPLVLGANWETSPDARGCNCPRGDTCAADGPNTDDMCQGSCGCWIGLLSDGPGPPGVVKRFP